MISRYPILIFYSSMERKRLMCASLDSPTPTVLIFGDSTRVMLRCGQTFPKAAAVIHPDEPPPTIVTFFIFIDLVAEDGVAPPTSGL